MCLSAGLFRTRYLLIKALRIPYDRSMYNFVQVFLPAAALMQAALPLQFQNGRKLSRINDISYQLKRANNSVLCVISDIF